ncbi:hypothetical protein LOK49_LG03G02518 [Camellia lanceoleosa]|uniref:Uncharacterized protein n=1 Tax=Camellia lanceoleosa TaxID=1840588 RepID=A0ACC0IEF3_9ERIC|nr:hypothetical protein LOK49_LG03G02518 [Camellia lanceoleosa]
MMGMLQRTFDLLALYSIPPLFQIPIVGGAPAGPSILARGRDEEGRVFPRTKAGRTHAGSSSGRLHSNDGESRRSQSHRRRGPETTRTLAQMMMLLDLRPGRGRGRTPRPEIS